MKYQLVLQFPEEKYGDLDWIADIQDKLELCIFNAEIDGHDIGSGEVNIFICTDTPVDTFNCVEKILKENSVFDDVKIAYRNFDNENYICLWPTNLPQFKVM